MTVGHHYAWNPKGLSRARNLPRPLLALRRRDGLVLACTPGVAGEAYWLPEELFGTPALRDLGPANPRRLAEAQAKWRDA